MSDTLSRPPVNDRAGQLLLEVTTSRSRRIKNQLATIWMYGAFVLALIPLGFVMFYVVTKGASQLSVDWFIRDIPATARRAGPGMGPAIVGTIVITPNDVTRDVPIGTPVEVTVEITAEQVTASAYVPLLDGFWDTSVPKPSVPDMDDLRERMIESTQTQIEVDEPEEDAMALLLGAEVDRPKPSDDESEERMLRMMLEANQRA